jgi:hypothetical protein
MLVAVTTEGLFSAIKNNSGAWIVLRTAMCVVGILGIFSIRRDTIALHRSIWILKTHLGNILCIVLGQVHALQTAKEKNAVLMGVAVLAAIARAVAYAFHTIVLRLILSPVLVPKPRVRRPVLRV